MTRTSPIPIAVEDATLTDRPVGLRNDGAHAATAPSSFDFGSATAGAPDLLATNAALTEQIRLFDTVLENMSQRLCMFDGQSSLVVSNRRYHEIFAILADAIERGMTQHDICTMLIAQGCYPPSANAPMMIFGSGGTSE